MFLAPDQCFRPWNYAQLPANGYSSLLTIVLQSYTASSTHRPRGL